MRSSPRRGEKKLSQRSNLSKVFALLLVVLLIAGLFISYEATVAWQVSPMGWNEGIGATVLVVVVLYVAAEYLHFW